MFLEELSSHANQLLNTVLEYNPPKHGLPIAGAVMVSALFFLYMQRFGDATCVKKWDIGNKEVMLVKRKVNKTQYDLVWQVFNGLTMSQRIVTEDFDNLKTYKRDLTGDVLSAQFKRERKHVLAKIQKIPADGFFLFHLLFWRKRKADLDEEVKIDYLRSLYIENRSAFFIDHKIELASDGFPRVRKITASSQLDEQVTIDRDNMAVTIIVRKGTCGEGHAMIAYEGIKRGAPFIYYMHLKKGVSSGDVENITDTVSKSGNIAQSMTWKRASWKVYRMIKEAVRLEANKEQVPFTLLGNGSVINKVKNFLTREVKISYNCLNWAVKMLRLADILIAESTNLVDIPAWQVSELKDIRDRPRPVLQRVIDAHMPPVR